MDAATRFQLHNGSGIKKNRLVPPPVALFHGQLIHRVLIHRVQIAIRGKGWFGGAGVEIGNFT